MTGANFPDPGNLIEIVATSPAAVGSVFETDQGAMGTVRVIRVNGSFNLAGGNAAAVSLQ